MTVVAAVLYFVVPFDAVPDFLFGWGLVDDAAVLSFVAAQIAVSWMLSPSGKKRRRAMITYPLPRLTMKTINLVSQNGSFLLAGYSASIGLLLLSVMLLMGHGHLRGAEIPIRTLALLIECMYLDYLQRLDATVHVRFANERVTMHSELNNNFQ